MIKETITVGKAADKYEVSPASIRKMIEEGKVEAKRKSNAPKSPWAINVRSLEEHLYDTCKLDPQQHPTTIPVVRENEDSPQQKTITIPVERGNEDSPQQKTITIPVERGNEDSPQHQSRTIPVERGNEEGPQVDTATDQTLPKSVHRKPQERHQQKQNRTAAPPHNKPKRTYTCRLSMQQIKSMIRNMSLDESVAMRDWLNERIKRKALGGGQ